MDGRCRSACRASVAPLNFVSDFPIKSAFWPKIFSSPAAGLKGLRLPAAVSLPWPAPSSPSAQETESPPRASAVTNLPLHCVDLDAWRRAMLRQKWITCAANRDGDPDVYVPLGAVLTLRP